MAWLGLMRYFALRYRQLANKKRVDAAMSLLEMLEISILTTIIEIE